MIIESLLDTDFYKLTMGQIALHQFPWVNVEYAFKCRNIANWTEHHVEQIKEEVKHFCSLKLTDDELDYLRTIRFFKDSYIDFLKLYQPDYDHFSIKLEDGELDIRVKGSWFTTIYWEVPLLAMVNEIYFKDQSGLRGYERLYDKMGAAKRAEIPFIDFGTRRRYSAEWHQKVVERLTQLPTFNGTSNVMLAKKFGIPPIGTMAHELFQIGQALDVPLVDSQKRMLQAWTDEYRGDLGIALTDIIGIDAFLKDFDLYFAKLYDGLRHDSGSMILWADKVLEHYEKLGIDSKTKTLVFSDGLDFDKAEAICIKYKDRINLSFGIGTNLTNDFEEITPLQIVMKLIKVNGRPVAKISDSPGKGMCDDDEYVSYLKKVFGVKQSD